MASCISGADTGAVLSEPTLNIRRDAGVQRAVFALQNIDVIHKELLWARLDSNQDAFAYKATALPIELQARS